MFVEGDMDSPEEEVVYRLVDANGKGAFSGEPTAYSIMCEHTYIPEPGSLVSLSKENGMLFAFNSLSELMYSMTSMRGEFFKSGNVRLMRIKFAEKIDGDGQCIFRAV